MKIKRRHTTLLELLIALSLTMMVMSALTYFYYQLQMIGQEGEIQQKALFKQLYLSGRLMDTLPKASAPNSKNFFFFTSEANNEQILAGTSSLVFTYDNGIKFNSQFSNDVLARLFVDKDHRLCLGVWPAASRWEEQASPPMKYEVLSEDVQDLNFRFYIPPLKEMDVAWKQANIRSVLPDDLMDIDGEWRSDWPIAWELLPALVEIHLTLLDEKEDKIIFSYPLQNTPFLVIY